MSIEWDTLILGGGNELKTVETTAENSVEETVQQPSIFGCWPSGVELPATGGYVGTVSDNLPLSTRDVSVH